MADSDESSTNIKGQPTTKDNADDVKSNGEPQPESEPTVKDRGGGGGADQDTKYKSLNNDESLYAVVSSLLSYILLPPPNSASFFHRITVSFRDHLPRLRQASTTSGLNLLNWARAGSPLRLLLVISVGTITLLTLTGILVFLLFLSAATINAVIVSLFISLAAAGGFLAMFFASIAIVYIGVLSIAAFVISSVTISAVITAIIVTGWIGFFWTIWVALKKSAGLAKHSVNVTSSALTAWQAHRQPNH